MNNLPLLLLLISWVLTLLVGWQAGHPVTCKSVSINPSVL